MATLAYQTLKSKGHQITYQSAGGSGDKIRPNDRGGLWVRNASGSTTTVTLTTPALDKYGNAIADITFNVPTGQTVSFAPLPKDLADPSDKLIAVTMSDATGMSVAALQL